MSDYAKAMEIKKAKEIKHYPPAEERINIVSHAVGFVLSVVALVLLVRHASINGDAWHVVSFSIFGVSLAVLFAASTVYHSVKDPQFRRKMRIVDHASIYILIAGTYTPFTLVTLNGFTGWVVFGVTWGMAVTGIILKLFFTGRYDSISTLMYVFMGWIIVFAINPLIENLSSDGLFWLVAGGMAYTTGAILYSIKKIRFNHAIFHVFVLLGAGCHFISVYFYVLPID
jgi:hemolysin III